MAEPRLEEELLLEEAPTQEEEPLALAEPRLGELTTVIHLEARLEARLEAHQEEPLTALHTTVIHQATLALATPITVLHTTEAQTVLHTSTEV